MSKAKDKHIIVGLDIGTSKIAAAVGQLREDGSIEFIGLGQSPSTGLKRGVVVNIEATVKSIQKALEEAELMAGCEIYHACASISGSHIRSLNSHGIVAIQDGEVQPHDINQVINAAKAVAIPADQKILHILPQEFVIDNQENIREPIGISGVRLEAKVHMVTCAESAAQNIAKCIRRCGLEVRDMVINQLASSHAVLTDDEKELGVCLVDIGGGTTEMAVFANGAIRHTAVIPIAGDQVTNDIAVALRTPTSAADAIKLEYGKCDLNREDDREKIKVPGFHDRPGRDVPKRLLTEVITARYEELFKLVRAELKRSGFEDLLASGMVITGGAAQMQGAIGLAEHLFNMPVRLGVPLAIEGLDTTLNKPAFATCTGLVLHHHKNLHGSTWGVPSNHIKHGAWQRLKRWAQNTF